MVDFNQGECMKKSCFVLLVAVLTVGLFLAGCARNERPFIDRFETDPASDTLVIAGDTVKIILEVSDPEGDSLSVTLEADGGEFEGTYDGSDILWIAPNIAETYSIICTVTDRDTIIDSLDFVSDIISIQVQNYFPMDKDNWWRYEGFYYVFENISNAIERKVYSEEILGDGEVRWHIETTDSTAARITTDSLDYFSVKGGSVFESVRFYSRLLLAEGVICEMPVWKGKTWAYNEDHAATVIEIKDRGTEAFSFSSCVRIEIISTSNPAKVRTIWFAPDVGIITDQTEDDGSKRLDYELIDYELREE